MRTAEIAHLLDMRGESLARMAVATGFAAPIGTGTPRHWSPGDALALWVMRELASAPQYAEGARKCGEALDSGYPPAYLVTRGGIEYVVVIESECIEGTDETVAALLLAATDAGHAVRVVKLRPMVAALAPFCAELVDA